MRKPKHREARRPKIQTRFFASLSGRILNPTKGAGQANDGPPACIPRPQKRNLNPAVSMLMFPSVVIPLWFMRNTLPPKSKSTLEPRA